MWLETKGTSDQGRKDTKKMPQDLDYESAMQPLKAESRNAWKGFQKVAIVITFFNVIVD